MMTDNGTRPVDLARLAQLLDAYGADPKRWPTEERQGARDLIAASPEAEALVRRAAALDALFDQAPGREPPPELVAAILAAASRHPRRSRLAAALWPFGPVWQPAAALVGSALLGIALGVNAPIPFGADPAEQAVTQEEFTDLAFGPDNTLETLP
jgi:hypothetical protein